MMDWIAQHLLPRLPLLMAVAVALMIAGLLALLGVVNVGLALTRTNGRVANAAGWPHQFAMRRNWGGFGLENSGWILTPGLTQLLVGAAMTGLAVLVLWHALDIAKLSFDAGKERATTPAAVPATGPTGSTALPPAIERGG